MKQRFDIHVLFRDKRVKQGFLETQLETMKSCDFVCLAFARIYFFYGIFFHSMNQSWALFLMDVLWFLITRNDTYCSFADKFPLTVGGGDEDGLFPIDWLLGMCPASWGSIFRPN